MEGKTQLTKFTFYDLYAELMDTLTDEERGKLLRAMCAYAFENSPTALTDKKLVYLWGNIVDTLCVDKIAQESGRTPKGLNRQMKHFMFYRNFYEALPLMDDKQAGQFAKAIYTFALKEQEPKLTSPVDTYYKLAKRKLQLSKTRSKVGQIGGNAPRVKVTDEQINEQTRSGIGIDFKGFMRLHPRVVNDLYASRQSLLNGVDWAWLDIGLGKSEEYRNCTSLYKILSHYNEITAQV